MVKVWINNILLDVRTSIVVADSDRHDGLKSRLERRKELHGFSHGVIVKLKQREETSRNEEKGQQP